MVSRKVAVRLLIPAATLVAERGDLKCKPSELPIYTAESPKEQQETKVVREPGPVERQIGNVRRQVVSFVTQISDIQEHADNLYEDTKNQFNWLINYLRQEDNTTPRAGAIAIGGLTGFILGLRGGFFRRVIFTSGGALGMAALCYPKEAAEYSEIAATETKQYVKIAYNFYHGVKKDDPPLELPSLPKLPTSLSEVWNIAKGSNSNQNQSVTVQQSLAEVNEPEIVSDDDDDEQLVPLSNLKQSQPESHKVVSQIHSNANQDDCHCPPGTCLNPQNEVPPNHPSKH